jgi:hypothetical protein
MTTDKARKRAVRTRMAKTGESYTSARHHLLDRAEPRSSDPDPSGPTLAPLPPRMSEPEVSEEAVTRATGRGWDDWLRLLDARGVEGFSHRDTAAWLSAEHGVTGWWAQTITVGYERARGLRRANQTSTGFRVGVSRTLPAAADRVWPFLLEAGPRDAWLGAGTLRVRVAARGRACRFDFGDDGSRVLVDVTDRGDRTTVAIEHERLAGPDVVEERRAYWRARLGELAGRLAGGLDEREGRA